MTQLAVQAAPVMLKMDMGTAQVFAWAPSSNLDRRFFFVCPDSQKSHEFCNPVDQRAQCVTDLARLRSVFYLF
jgi:hypothetical protein